MKLLYLRSILFCIFFFSQIVQYPCNPLLLILNMQVYYMSRSLQLFENPLSSHQFLPIFIFVSYEIRSSSQCLFNTKTLCCNDFMFVVTIRFLQLPLFLSSLDVVDYSLHWTNILIRLISLKLNWFGVACEVFCTTLWIQKISFSKFISIWSIVSELIDWHLCPDKNASKVNF